ncbi:MAG: MAPEG family protein [Acidocella sp.]
MTSEHILLATGGVLGINMHVLSAMVTRQRYLLRVSLGDGGGTPAHEPLRVAMRAQANFAEYVPLILLLLGGLTLAGADSRLILGLSVVLVIARIAHPIGMYRPAPNPLRAGGIILTWCVLLVASFAAILYAL